MRKIHKRGGEELICVSLFHDFSDAADSDSEFIKIQNSKIKYKELEGEGRHKTIYTGSSYNTGVV